MQDIIKKREIKISQLVLMFILIIPGGKFLSLIALMAQNIGRDTPLAMTVLFAFDLVCLSAVLFAFVLNKQRRSFYHILCDSIGSIATKVIMAIYFLIFLMRITLLLVNTIHMFSSTFSVKTNWIAYSLPICALIVFVLWLGPNTIARLSESFFVFILLALLSILIFSAGQAQFSNLLPVCERGTAYFFRQLPRYTFWFGEAMFLLFFMDNIPKGKKTKVYPLFVAFAVGAVICVGLAAVFIGLFDTLAPYNNLAMSKVSQFIIKQTINGRLDWLSLVIWLISAYIKVMIMAYCMLKSLHFIIGKKQSKFDFVGACLMLLPVLVVPLLIDVEKTIMTYLCSRWPRYIMWVCQYLVLLLMPLFVYISKRKQLPKGFYTTDGCLAIEKGERPPVSRGKLRFFSKNAHLNLSKNAFVKVNFHNSEDNHSQSQQLDQNNRDNQMQNTQDNGDTQEQNLEVKE